MSPRQPGQSGPRRRARVSRGRVWAATLTGFAVAGAVGYVVTVGIDGIRDLVGDDAPPLAVKLKATGSLSGAAVPGTLSDFPGGVEELQSNFPDGAVWTDGGSGIVISTYGTADTPVLVTGIRAVDVACDPPSKEWTWLETEGGGAYIDLPVLIKLRPDNSSDSDRATELSFNGEDWTFPRQVSKSEAEGYDVEVDAPDGLMCKFRIGVTYETGDESGEVVLSQEGAPFAIADKAFAQTTVFLGG